jgi:hypothetical protein
MLVGALQPKKVTVNDVDCIGTQLQIIQLIEKVVLNECWGKFP